MDIPRTAPDATSTPSRLMAFTPLADRRGLATRLTPPGHPTINLDGRYRTTSRPPTSGLRPLRI